MGLFDERNLFEVTHPDFPNERLVACRNPELAERRRHKRRARSKRSEAAMRKIQTKKLDDGSPASSFRTLLRLLSNIVRNKCRSPGAASSDMTFDVTTSPDSKQRRAYELLKGITV